MDYLRPGTSRDQIVEARHDSFFERTSKRVASLWVIFTAGLGIFGAGFGASTALLAWQVKGLEAQLSAIRQELSAIRVDLRAEAETRNTDRQHIAALNAAVGLLPYDTLTRMRAANKVGVGDK